MGMPVKFGGCTISGALNFGDAQFWGGARTRIFTLLHTIPTFNDTEKEGLENHGGLRKRENAGYQHFSPFPTIISTIAKTNFNFSVTFILSSPNAFNLDKFKNLSLGKELINI